MHPVPREQNPAGGVLRPAFPEKFPFFLKTRRFHAEVYGRYAVMPCKLLELRYPFRHFAFPVIFRLSCLYGVQETDIRVGAMPDYLADNAFHSIRISSVDSKFEEHKVRVVAQHLLVNPERAEVRARA